MIETEDIAFAFNGQSVLDSVSLDVRKGEIVGLIGPNGAGKTTFLRLVSGVLEPDRGSIHLDGDAVGTLSADELGRRISVVPQQTELSFDFSIRDVITMGRNPYQGRLERLQSADRSLVNQAMAQTDTDHLADRPFSAVSGGERKRVLIARAIAQDTPAMLVDEPTASLDINHQVAVFELLRGLVGDDKAILTAVHDLNLAARYCDRLVLLHDGQVKATGTAEDVLQPKQLHPAYGIDTTVEENPVTGTPMVVAHPRSTESS